MKLSLCVPIKISLVACCQMYMADPSTVVANPSQDPVQDMTMKKVKR